MTSAVNALSARTEPAWCSDHYEPAVGEALHQHDYRPTWGAGDEQIRVGLTRYDCRASTGQDRIDIQYLADGVTLEGSVSLSAADARAFAFAVLQATTTAERPTRSRMGLLLGCVYEFGKAFAAAVRIERARSLRTASSASRSMISL